MLVDRTPQRILAIKLADLGDLLLCEPAFRSLREAFPSARIDVLTTPSSIPILDLIGHDLTPMTFPKHLFDAPTGILHPAAAASAGKLALQLRRANYDRVVIFHHLTTAFGARKFAALVTATGSAFVAGLDNGRGTFLTHRVIDEGFGARHEAEYMRDVAVAADGAVVDPLPTIATPSASDVTAGLPTNFAAIYPVTGAFSRAREWPLDRYVDLAERVLDRGVIPVVVGADDTLEAAARIVEDVPGAVSMAGLTSIPQLAAILAEARFVVGGDSFIGHLAAAVGTPVISIFGPSNANAWRPSGSADAGTAAAHQRGSIVIQSDLPCAPCIYTGYRLGRPSGCPDRTCLKRITVDDVDRVVASFVGVA